MRKEVIDTMLELLDEVYINNAKITKDSVIKLSNALNMQLTDIEVQEIVNLY